MNKWVNPTSKRFARPGKTYAMYLLDFPYPDQNKINANIKALANRTPDGMVPTGDGLGNVVVSAATKNAWSDYFGITKKAVIETAQEFKQVAVIAAAVTRLIN